MSEVVNTTEKAMRPESMPFILPSDLLPSRRIRLPLTNSTVSESFDDHLVRYGAVTSRPTRKALQEVISLAERWDIKGRGGASFPLSRKLLAVARSTSAGKKSVIVANGSESEPLSFKDRGLLWANPHLVFDALELVSLALGSTEIFLVIHEDPLLSAHLNLFASQRPPRRGSIDIVVAETFGGYVSGQETALVNFLEKGKVVPRFQPPRPSAKGVRGRPTLVSNVETLARLALAYHAESKGSVSSSGLKTLGVLGTAWTKRGGFVFEALPHETLGEVFTRAGETLELGSTLLMGGYFGRFSTLDSNLIAMPFSEFGSRALSFGAGITVVFPPDACVIDEADHIISYLGSQSAGQCGPCMFGLPAISNEFHRLAEGAGGDIDKIWHWSGQLPGRGACAMPDGFSALVRSLLRVKLPELQAHAGRRCMGRKYSIVSGSSRNRIVQNGERIAR